MTNYLNLDTDGALRFTPTDMVGKMIALMGGTGSGKSYSMGVLAEELMSLFPLTIVDTAGEYWTLQEVFNVLIVGREWWSEGSNPVRIDHCNLEIGSADDAEKIAEYSFRNKVSVILELRYFDDHVRNELLSAYFSRLWELILRQPKPQPYGIFIDEAQNYVPQQSSKYSIKGILTKFAKEGRKEGVTCVFGTQRAASISKDVLNMCGMRILHRVYYPTDIEVYADGVPLREAAEVRKLNRELQPGDAIFVNEPDSWVVRMRSRRTTHAGLTPTLEGHAPTLREVDKQTVEDLKALLVPAVEEVAVDGPANAAQRDLIATLQRENAAQKKEIAQLCKDVDHWKGLVQGQSIADAVPNVQLRMDVEGLPDELLMRAKKRESMARNRVVNRQINNLKRLRAETLKLSACGQEILFWMSRTERHGVWFSIEHIAQVLRLSQNSIRMQELVATKLVERDKSSRIHKFRFKKGHIEQSFPDLDTAFVLDHISSIKEKVA